MKRCLSSFIIVIFLATPALAQSGDLSDGIQKGYRIFPLLLKDAGAAAQTIKPANRVDLIVTVPEVTGGQTQLVTRVAIQDVAVRGSESLNNGSLVKLEITLSESQFLTALTHDAQYAIALRSRTDVGYGKDLGEVNSKAIKARLEHTDK